MIPFIIILICVLLHPMSDAIRDCGYKKQQKQGMIAFIFIMLTLQYFATPHDILYVIVLIVAYTCLRIALHDTAYVLVYNLEHEKKDWLQWYYVSTTSGIWSKKMGEFTKWEALTGRICALIFGVGFYLLWYFVWK
jgi:hypothetical protein